MERPFGGGSLKIWGVRRAKKKPTRKRTTPRGGQNNEESKMNQKVDVLFGLWFRRENFREFQGISRRGQGPGPVRQHGPGGASCLPILTPPVVPRPARIFVAFRRPRTDNGSWCPGPLRLDAKSRGAERKRNSAPREASQLGIGLPRTTRTFLIDAFF